MAEPLDAELLKDLVVLGGPQSIDGVDRWERLGVSRLSLQLRDPHEPRQFCFSRADRQMRNRAKSDFLDISESVWRCTTEMLFTDVIFTGLDNERQCPNCFQIRGGNQRS